MATAGGDSVGRGETLTQVHASELAFWPKSTAQDIWTGLTQAVPNTPGTSIFVESTANGITGVFYDLWQGAVAGENGFVPVFIPWFADPTYRETAPANFELTPEEEGLVEAYGLDNDQLQFRRMKIAQNGLDGFNVEYPDRPESAFLNTGRPVFNPEQLTKMLDDAKDPIERLALEGDEFVHNRRGELTTYIPHDPGGRYVVGADPAMGIASGDFSVAQVLDEKKRLVATWRGRVHLIISRHTVCPRGLLQRGAHHRRKQLARYPDLYEAYQGSRLSERLPETQVDKITERETVKLGFGPRQNQTLIIDQLRAAMRERAGDHDKTTLREMMTYIVTESGSMEAEAGCHDDTVMALALANHVHEGAWEPVETPPELYIEMV